MQKCGNEVRVVCVQSYATEGVLFGKLGGNEVAWAINMV